MDHHLPDEDLALFARQEDASYFRELVSRHEKKVLRFLTLLTKNEVVAHELAQEAFIDVYQNLYQFNPRISFSIFVFRHVYKQVLRYGKKNNLTDETNLAALLSEELQLDVTIEDEFEDKALVNHITRFCSKIPLKNRIPVLLHFIDGFSYAEIADILQVSTEVVLSRIVHGEHMLKKYI